MAVITVSSGNSSFITFLDEYISTARSGDIIRLLPGTYEISSPIDRDLTFESVDFERPASFSGPLTMNSKKCTFKNLVFEQFFTKAGVFYDIQNSYLIIESCLFKDIETNKSIISLVDSRLELQGSHFLGINANAINASGTSVINADDCEFQTTGFPSIYLQPKVTAEIRNSFFNAGHSTVFLQQAVVTLIDCGFIDIDESHTIEATQNSTMEILGCTFFNNLDHYIFYADDKSIIRVTNYRIDYPGSLAISNSYSKVEFVGGELFGDTKLDPSLYLTKNGGEVLYVHTESTEEDQMIEVNKTIENCLQELNGLTGLNNVKDQIRKIIAFLNFQQQHEQRHSITLSSINLHMVFTGNPGTGKTTVARLVGKIYNQLGVLQTDKVVEVERANLVGEYIGKTAPKTLKVINQAMNGVLFIDEAYTLAKGGNDLGQEAIDTLLKQMEDNKDKLAVIVAGYTKPMEKFIDSNPGLKSRFTRYIEFEDFDTSELLEIFENICIKQKIEISDSAHSRVKEVIQKMYDTRNANFGNARDIENLFDEVKSSLSVRHLNDNLQNNYRIEKEDVDTAAEQMKITAVNAEPNRLVTLNEGLSELNSLIGLESVKSEIKKLTDFVTVQKRRKLAGLPTSSTSLHLVFTGNPGTGKTTVARIMGKIYYGLGLLNTSKLIETDRSALVGKYVGRTAKDTLSKINESMDGVLFIDEAYTLVKEGKDFGQEAIDTLLKQMEDHRDRFAVIVAGYTNPMQVFIKSNPGLESRFTRTIEFEDYNPSELFSIFEELCKKESYSLTESAQKKVSSIFEKLYEEREDNFGNGRLVRNLFNKTRVIHSSRVALDPLDSLDIIEAIDIPDFIK
ncbi:AAA family ATPase [Psychrobacter celer]|uniref:AAA family ATPase n=1 Tax=Psychrobacter celer TaxID=306572 RepID=UPI003FCF087C